MRPEKILKDVTVLNKVDNKLYKIMSVDNGIGIACLLEDGEIKESVSVKISEANAIAYRLIDNPNIPEIPVGYTVNNGILLKDGVPATEQGSLVINKIITCVPGKLLLAVLPREGMADYDDYVDMFSYKPSEDRFKKLIPVSIPMPEIVDVYDKYVVLKTSRTHVETEKDENNNDISNEYLDNSELIVYNGASNYISSYLNLDAPIDNIIKVRNSENIPTWVIEYTKMAESHDYCDEDDYDEYDEDYDDNEDNVRDVISTGKLIDRDDIKAEMIALNGNSLMRLNSINIPTHIKSVSIGWNNADFIRLEDRIMIGEYVDKIITDPKIMVAVEGYNWIVDTTKENDITRIALANDQMEVKYIVIHTTSDRGDIITIE